MENGERELVEFIEKEEKNYLVESIINEVRELAERENELIE